MRNPLRALLFVVVLIHTNASTAFAVDKETAQQIIAIYESAINLRKDGKMEEAEKVARDGLKRFPDSEDLMIVLADVLNFSGRSTEAVRYYESALAKQPKAPQIHSALCSAQVSMGEYKEAVNHCEQAGKLDPNDGTVWFNLGRSYAALGDYPKARLNYEKYSKKFGDSDPDNTFVIQARSEAARLAAIIENRTSHGAPATQKREGFSDQEEVIIKEIIRRYTKLGMPEAEAEATVNGMREAWISIPKGQREQSIKQMRDGLPG